MKPTSRGIDIVAFSGTRIWSQVIRWRSKSAYSHVGIVCEIDGDEWVIESAEKYGVRIIPLRVWYTWSGTVTAFAVDPDVIGGIGRQKMIDYAKARIGCEYASWRQLLRSFGFISPLICKILGVAPDIEPTRMVCSELVAESLQAAGAKLPCSPAAMRPGDVVRLPCVFPIVERVQGEAD